MKKLYCIMLATLPLLQACNDEHKNNAQADYLQAHQGYYHAEFVSNNQAQQLQLWISPDTALLSLNDDRDERSVSDAEFKNNQLHFDNGFICTEAAEQFTCSMAEQTYALSAGEETQSSSLQGDFQLGDGVLSVKSDGSASLKTADCEASLKLVSVADFHSFSSQSKCLVAKGILLLHENADFTAVELLSSNNNLMGYWL
ncbi:MAG: hypothetical protein H7A09_10250 [Oceanospirillaceae bacterium]|nr:hypothetical protein [Oceanospirillaceae bacterium]